jgi:hypothetical protein
MSTKAHYSRWLTAGRLVPCFDVTKTSCWQQDRLRVNSHTLVTEVKTDRRQQPSRTNRGPLQFSCFYS